MVKRHEVSCLKVTIIGNTLGALLSDKGAAVKLWARSAAEAKELNQGRRSYSSTSHIGEASNGADPAIWAVPSQKLRQNISQAKH